MKRGVAAIMVWVLLIAASVGAWRIVRTGMAALLAPTSPEKALEWNSADPTARLAVAQEQFQRNSLEAATNTAKALLREEPAAAESMVLLARIAELRGDPDTFALFEIAIQRAPRNQYARGWMIDHWMQSKDYAQALNDIDRLLSMAPWHRDGIVSLLIDWAEDPKFAAALVDALQRSSLVGWQAGFLDRLVREGSLDALTQVLGGLQRQGALDARVETAWLNRLINAGLWGEAYSRWLSGLSQEERAALGLVFDGGFELPASNSGFGWDMSGSPGTLIERKRSEEGQGYITNVSFLGRRAAQINFSQTLLLAPGRYRMQIRARAQSLRGDRGLAWRVSCRGTNPMQADTAALLGMFDWKSLSLEFEVPADGCPAQKLALVNLGADGAGKIVSGSIAFDDVLITSLAAESHSDRNSGRTSPSD